MISELQRLGERAFIFRLRENRPDISEAEVSAEVAKWWLTRDDQEVDKCFVRRTDLVELWKAKSIADF